MTTVIVLAVLALAVILALKKIVTDQKKGGCGGCSGNCNHCSHAKAPAKR